MNGKYINGSTAKDGRVWEMMACPCCRKLPLYVPVYHYIMAFSTIFGGIWLNSTYRCKAHNREVGGSKGSTHMDALAIDFLTGNIKRDHKKLLKLFPNSMGIGLYKTHIHFDCRQSRARWKG